MTHPGNHPPEPHTPTWCEQNPKRCKENEPSASIDNPYFIAILILVGSILILNKLKIINMKNIFENLYDKISIFLFGTKSFRWGELKGL